MMNTLLFTLMELFAFRKVLKKHFNFLEKDFGYVETKDPKLIIPEWLIRGIAYTNKKIVIVITDDVRERNLVTIIYRINSNYEIPIYTKDYFTLHDYFTANGASKREIDEMIGYSDKKGLKRCIENTAYHLNKEIEQIVAFESTQK